jgi:hypothetical protein
MYWNEQYPWDILGVDLNNIIDIDETAFKLKVPIGGTATQFKNYNVPMQELMVQGKR